MQRAASTCSALSRRQRRPRPWLRQAACTAAVFPPVRRDSAAQTQMRRPSTNSVRSRGGDGVHGIRSDGETDDRARTSASDHRRASAGARERGVISTRHRKTFCAWRSRRAPACSARKRHRPLVGWATHGDEGICQSRCRARVVAARSAARARAHRQPSGRPWVHRQRRGPGVRPRAVFAAEGKHAAVERRDVRPSLSDGRDSARWSRVRYRAARAGADERRGGRARESVACQAYL